MPESDSTQELIRLIEADHRMTVDLVSRLAAATITIRGIAVSLSSALAGVALTNENWGLAAAGILIVVVAAVAEALNDFLRVVTHNRAVRLERKMQAYISWLKERGAVRDDAEQQLNRELDTYQFGTSRSLRPSPLGRALRNSLKRLVFWIYPVLVIMLVVVMIGLNGSE